MELSDKQETEFQTQSKGHAGNFCGNVLPQVSPSYFVSFYPLSTHELRWEGRCLEIETLVHIWEPGYVSHTSASPTSRSHSCGWEIGKHRCQHNASITLAFVLSPGDCTSLAHVQWHIPLQSPWWLNPAHSDAVQLHRTWCWEEPCALCNCQSKSLIIFSLNLCFVSEI